MGRISELDRLPIVDAFIGHWTEANALGAAIVIATGYGLPQLVAQRAEYHAKGEEITDLETQVAIERAGRDAIFGTTFDDDNGIWFRFRQYKPMVRLTLGARHPLAQTIPNLGIVRVERYLTIIHRFTDHWERVNAELATPMALGDFDLTDLQAAHNSLVTKIQAVQAIDEGSLPLARAEREKLFGDVPEDVRDDESIIARLQLYAITIQTMFPGQPIAQSLPEIFPGTTPPAPLPTFRFNWVAQGGGQVKTWLEVPMIAGADMVFLKEGVLEDSEPFNPSAPDGVQVITWSGVTIVDELDEFEIRSAAGTTLALGQRDTSFPEPVLEDPIEV